MKEVISKKIIISIVLFLSVILLVGCFPRVQPENKAPVFTSSPVTSATVGEQYTYEVKATDPDGDVLTYSLTTKPTGMDIDPDTGLITWTPDSAQIGVHDVTVVVSDGKKEVVQNFKITVSTTPAPPSPTPGPSNRAPKINSSPIRVATINVEYIYQIEATDADGDTLTYSLTKNPDGMEIDPDTGLITWTPDSAQIGAHDVTVEVSDGKAKATQSFKVYVFDILESIKVTPKDMSLFVSESRTIEWVTLYWENINNQNVHLSSCDYSSDDDSVATVSEDGVITGVAAGKATITVSYTANTITKTDTVEVTVNPIELQSITVVPKTMTLYPDQTGNITSVTASYDYGSDKTIPLASCNYSTSAAGVATASDGVITGVAAGTATITVSYTEGSITKTDTVEVTVNPIELQSITVTPKTMTLFTTEEDNINSVTASYNYGPTKSIALSSCTFSSGNTSIATVTAAGVITGVAAGTATITVSYTEGSITKSDTVTVTVKVANLELRPATQTLASGSPVTINVVVEDVSNLLAGTITLNFDNTKLQYDSNLIGAALPGGFFTGAFMVGADVTNGSVRFDFMSLEDPAPSGSGILFAVKFNTIATGTANITFGATGIYDEEGALTETTMPHTKGSGCTIAIQ